MKVFSSLPSAMDVLAGHKKWDRTFEAIRICTQLPAGPTYSVGDSLTWRIVKQEDSDKHFVARRRYQRVLYCLSGQVEYDICAQWESTQPYSDLSDTHTVVGEYSTHTLPPGNLLIVDITEGTRIRIGPDGCALLLHVTVEGHSFHNK
ncbi:hypothetical protein [Schaalia sp. lx-260]|uniref:hypothetical protein n=1 Tax=Schaalia sp. lx-260 TaxID=2899082 RepID=UPI001E3849B2|nr:hypothetical protein [Schaalia sp. lx-260]MCD4549768.1 hypothetical protein [Schaalia sp. lx-260]